MTEQELNKKLAEWAGFTYEEYLSRAMCGWVNPLVDRKNVTVQDLEYDVPNFTNSLDACFKWLVPKIKDLSDIFVHPYSNSCSVILRFLGSDRFSAGEGETPALALCKAIEKLIDGEKGGLSG